MNHEQLIGKILHMSEQATLKPWSEQSVNNLDICYNTLQEIRDLISEYTHEQQTSGTSEAGKQVLDTIQICEALNKEAMR